MKASARENSFQVLAFAVLFAGLAVLAGFFLAGESRRARILAEYEADRTASALVEAYRNGDEIDASAVDPRVLGFGIYRSGEPLVRLREAPPALGGSEQDFGFAFDPRSRTLLVVKPLGVGGMGMTGMLPPQAMGRRGAPMGRGPGRAGVAALLMDARGYYRSRALSRAAAIAAPLVIAGLTALFLSLAASNRRYRRAAEDREMLARLGEVSHTLAHEIRNPLGAIRIQTALLRRAADPASAEKPLTIIDEEVARLTLLTRRIGDYLREPRGNPEPIAVDPFLRGVASRLPWSVQLRLEAGEAQVSCDRELLRSVIENLARNAHESYPEEAPPQSRQVLLETALKNDRVAISVCDRGSGIPPEKVKEAFAPFVTDKVGGSGIGLAISKRFVEAAGGTLELVPGDDGGTRARLLLPTVSAAGDPS
jgi:signal transduction histidine kinase